MLKIGILTINDYNNYGNRLQNYATQEILIELNLDVETIVNNTMNYKCNKKDSNLARLINLCKLKPTQIYNKLNHRINYEKSLQIQNMRKKAFKNFTYNHIIETSYSISDKDFPDNLSNNYDYFITGSDQVWNPAFDRFSEIDFLTFAQKHKRIAFSPSFGVSEIPIEHLENYKRWLADIQMLSVREDAGAKIIKELVGREVPVLVDPTLLITKDKWISMSKQANNRPKGKYLLTYFLGGVPKEYKNQINKIAEVNNLEIINLGDITEIETYKTGPSEFIDYINFCSIMCTDSFHGAVFSILFEKPFIIYKRIGSSTSMYSRIDTLLYKFDLDSRKAENINTNEEVFNIDYSHVHPILKLERQKSREYLKKALNINDGN